MLSINTNLNAQNAANQIANSQKAINTASERLTTGLRINNSADDVSGMGLASRLAKTSTQTAQYTENASNGISLLQTADAAYKQQAELTARLGELAFKAENGSNSTEDRALIQKEFDQLTEELQRNYDNAEYNGTNIFDGGMGVSIAVGEGTDNQIDVNLTDTQDLITALQAVVLDGHADGDEWVTAVHEIIENFADEVTNARADIGAVQNRLEFTTQNLQAYKQNIDASLSLTQDTDYAQETTNLAKANVLKNASQSMLSQANQSMDDVVNKLLN
ncbi:Flagellin [Vibrio chagasii]|nr:Flagellin [Vibrio chagasii]